MPGDGRELVAADPSAVSIRAEDGRRVAGVDISPFINGLPAGRPVANFCTDDASGSTSQAANIQVCTCVHDRVQLNTCTLSFVFARCALQGAGGTPAGRCWMTIKLLIRVLFNQHTC